MTDPFNGSENALELNKMFHEIKNPLTLITSSLQLIESDHPEVTSFRFWNQTMKDVQNLRLLIDDLSSYEKSSSLRISRIHLFDFVEDLLESMESFLLETGIPLTLDNAAEELDFEADEGKLRQAIINLLKNAAESSQAGSPIELFLTADAEALHITVTDHGCGMDEEQLAHAFDPYHTTKSYGTGLGLPIVKKIIQSHHGAISIQSEKGVGTTVTLRLPLS